MAGLSIKIAADTAGAVAAFRNLAGGSEEMAAAISKANDKLAKIDVQGFVQRQSLTVAALTATRGELGAVESSITSYQRKIEDLVKKTMDPESEQVKTLQFELETLKQRRYQLEAQAAASAEAEKRLTEAWKEAAEAAEKEAGIAVKSLDAKTALEKANVRLASGQDELKDKIRELVESGVKPESAEVQKLQGEYKKLSEEIEANTKAEELRKNVTKGVLAGFAAVGAAIAGAAVYAVKAAGDVQDMEAAFTPMMGSADKAAAMVKRINIEAASTPFEIETIGSSVKRLLPAFQGSGKQAIETFRMLGDTAGGSAQKLDTITNAYTKAMLSGKVGMEELNMISDAGVPIFTELAASMGVSVTELREMSSGGKIASDDLTKAFQRMTGEGGIFFNGMEVSSKTFSMTLLGIQENIKLAAAAIGEHLLPFVSKMAGKVYDTVGAFAEWVSNGENLKDLLAGLAAGLSGAAIALGGFMIIANKAAILSALSGAFNAVSAAVKGFTSALAANPLGLIAVAITAVLIPAIILLVRHWDMVQTYLQQGIGRLEYAFKWFASVIKEVFITAVNGIKMGFASLVDLIYGNLLRGISDFLEMAGNLPFVGEMFKGAADFVGGLSRGLDNLTDTWKRESDAAIQAAKAEQDATEDALRTKLAAIDAEAEARRAALKAAREAAEEEADLEAENAEAKADAAESGSGGSGGGAKDRESEYEQMMKRIRTEIAETGKSERELAQIRVGAVTGIDAERAAYMKLHDELQALKDEESLEEMTADYIEKLEELHIKKDEEKNDEAQLLELQRRRALAEIEAYTASAEAKKAAVDKLNEYYDLMKETAGEDGKKEKEEDPAAAFKKRIDDELKYSKDGMKGRIDILRRGLADIETASGISAEKQKEIQHDLSEKLKAEEESWKQVKINTALQALSAVQELTNVFGDIAQQQADERYAREAERLEERKNDNSKALIDQFNEEVSAEGLADEEKEKKKKEFLERYKQNETDYTDALEKEEEKRKNAAREAAIADKAISAATAGINSMVAFTGVLAAWSTLNPILAAVQAGAILASGLAQQAKIIATPISAETGGRFMVPDTGGGVDSAYMRVNAGEEATIIPRGEGGGTVTHIILQIEKRTIFDVVNDGIRSGEIRPAANL